MSYKSNSINKSAQEILSKGGVFFVLKIAALLLSYIFSIVVTRYFDETIYGMVTLGFTILIIVSTICRFGFDITLTKIFAFKDTINYNGVYLKAILLSASLSLPIAGIIYFNSEFIATAVFKNAQFSPFLKWTALTIPLWTLVPINASVFRGLKKNTLFALFDSFGRFFLTVVFFLVFLNYNFDAGFIEMPLVSHFLSLLLLLVISSIIIYKILKQTKFPEEGNFRLHLNASSAIFISSALFIILSWIDKIIIGVYTTEDSVGIFHISERVAALIGFNLEAINSILSPKISRAFSSNNLSKMQKDINFSVSISFLLSVVSCIIIVIFAETILGFFGSEYIKGKYILYVFAVSHLINVSCGSVGNIMQMTGLQKLFSKIVAVALALHVVLSIFFIQSYGVIGVAFSTAIAVVFWNVTGAYYIRKKLGVTSFITLKKLKSLSLF